MTLQRITPCLWFDKQAKSDRVMAARLKMKKIDLAELNQAFAG